MKSIKFTLFILLGLIFLNSCNSKTEEYNPTKTDNYYYPIQIGSTWIYSLDSIIYDRKGLDVDTIKGLIKETILDSFIDITGTTNFTIERSNKKGNNWVVSNIWSTSKNEGNVIRNEDNLKFIKMITPIEKNQSWDGNAYIDTENLIVKIAGESIQMYNRWYYQYLDINKPETVGSITYDNVLTIQQVDNETKLEKRYSLEKYAENIGLIYKKMIILNTQVNNETIPWEERAEEGFILEQKLISYTK